MDFTQFLTGACQILDYVETSTGVHVFSHNLGHVNYTVCITLKESGVYAYLASKSEDTFTIHVRSFSGTFLSSAFDISIIGNN